MKSTKILQKCADVQAERGKEYDEAQTGERSFSACADAFNAITGESLQGSHVCLMLQLLKDVRQYSNPSRIHEDSLLDKVSYASLHVEELYKEIGSNKCSEVKSVCFFNGGIVEGSQKYLYAFEPTKDQEQEQDLARQKIKLADDYKKGLLTHVDFYKRLSGLK